MNCVITSSLIQVITQLRNILIDKIKEYIVCQEKHEHNGLQVHSYLKLNLKITILDSQKLDLIDSSDNKIHGQYESVKNIKNVRNYVKKSSTKFKLDDFNPLLIKEINVFKD